MRDIDTSRHGPLTRQAAAHGLQHDANLLDDITPADSRNDGTVACDTPQGEHRSRATHNRQQRPPTRTERL